MSTIAVFGLNGLLGHPVVNALLDEPFISQINTPIRLLTSSDKKPFQSLKVEYYNVKKDDGGFAKALQGVDAVVNLSNVPGKPEDDAFLQAVIHNKVKLYIPSQFGTDIKAASKILPNFLQPKEIHSKAARDGGIKTVDVITGLLIKEDGFFPSAPLAPFNPEVEKTNEVTIRGDEHTLVNPSFLRDVGYTIASLLTRGKYSGIPDTIRVYSDRVFATDFIKHYENVHKTELKINYESSDKFIKEVQEKYNKTGFQGPDFGVYLATFIAAGEGNGLIYEKNHQKEFVNPGESLFTWTKYQV